MNTPNISENENSKRTDIPNLMALILGLFFWIILLPLVHAGIPWFIASLGHSYGWRDGRPSNWNLLGLIPVAMATICLIWQNRFGESSTPLQLFSIPKNAR